MAPVRAPDIQPIGLDLSPSDHPLSYYPEGSVTTKCLLLGSWLYVLRPIPGLPLADCKVRHGGRIIDVNRLGALSGSMGPPEYWPAYQLEDEQKIRTDNLEANRRNKYSLPFQHCCNGQLNSTTMVAVRK